jgi:DNA (cytosine-5)-methyltransferase 1
LRSKSYRRPDYPQMLDRAWQAHIAPRAQDAPTVVSLFAGCGGSSLGYSMAGYREVLAVEWDRVACSTLRRNFPSVPLHEGDIAKLAVEEALEVSGLAEGELDLLDGSPPCQGFSTAGKRKVTDPRNSLFREYVRLLSGLRPRALVMENVTGLVKGRMRPVFVEILRELRASGYRVKAAVLDARHLGVPQHRERLFFLGVREDLGVEPQFPGQKEVNAAFAPWEPCVLTLEDAFKGLPAQVGEGFSADLAALSRRVLPWKDGSSILPGHAFNQKRLAWDRPSRTVPKMVSTSRCTYGGGLIHPDEDQHLTIAELKRIASIPDQYELAGAFQQRWAQVGNSVPPLMARAVASCVALTLSSPGDSAAAFEEP